MGKKTQIIAIAVVVGLAIAASCLFTVKETERAIMLKFGEITRADFQPGLHARLPIIHSIRKFDARIHTLDSPAEQFLTSEKKNLIVDYFVKWRIADVGRYFTSTGGGDERSAQSLMNQTVKDGLKAEFSRRTIQEAVSGERGEIMRILADKANEDAQELGIEIVDVRIKRIDLSSDVSDSVYSRMRAERQRVAEDFRARGREAKERIQAEADRKALIIVAEAERDADRLRGEGDAKAANIYTESFGANTEFYSFYRSLQAYRDSIGGADDVLVISPNSEFFDYFKNADN